MAAHTVAKLPEGSEWLYELQLDWAGEASRCSDGSYESESSTSSPNSTQTFAKCRLFRAVSADRHAAPVDPAKLSQIDDDVAARLRAANENVAIGGLLEWLRSVGDGP
jgi:hypothetical protein